MGLGSGFDSRSMHRTSRTRSSPPPRAAFPSARLQSSANSAPSSSRSDGASSRACGAPPRSATVMRAVPPHASTAAATCRGRNSGCKAGAEGVGAVGAVGAEQAHRRLTQQLSILHVQLEPGHLPGHLSALPTARMACGCERWQVCGQVGREVTDARSHLGRKATGARVWPASGRTAVGRGRCVQEPLKMREPLKLRVRIFVATSETVWSATEFGSARHCVVHATVWRERSVPRPLWRPLFFGASVLIVISNVQEHPLCALRRGGRVQPRALRRGGRVQPRVRRVLACTRHL